MSYDIYLEKAACPTCGHHESREVGWVPSDGRGSWATNPTYNLTPIFDLALTGEPLPNEGTNEASVVLLGTKTDRPRGLRVLSGRRAADTVPMLEAAIARCSSPEWRPKLLVLEPSNGWGTLASAEDALRGMLVAAKERPGYMWEIH